MEVRRLDALTGLRFVAAAAVVLHHMDGWSPGRFGLPAHSFGTLALGATGVSFFFVLSGFILAYVYPRLDSPGGVGRFLLARFARLYPAHLLGIALSMVVARAVYWPASAPGMSDGSLLAVHLGMIQSWFPTEAVTRAYNSPSWSIATEFAFYLFFVPLIHNWERTWWWKLPLTAVLPVGLAVVANQSHWPWAVPEGAPAYQYAIEFNPLARLYQFALGMAVALAWRRTEHRLRVGLVVGTAAEAAAAGLLVAAVYFSGPVGTAARDTPWLGQPMYHLLHGCGLSVTGPCAVLVFVVACGRGLVSRLFATGPAVALGDISFGVYILHAPLLTYLITHEASFAGVRGWKVGAGYAAVLLLAARWSHGAVEQPARRWLVGLWPAGAGGRVGRLASARGVFETVVLIVVVLAVVQYDSAATFRYVPAERAEQQARAAPTCVEPVRFGDAYLLRSASFHPAADGVQLRLVWASLKSQPPGFCVWVQGTDPAPAEECLWAAIDRPDLGRRPVPPGAVWEQRIFLPAGKLAAAAQVVVIVWNKDETAFLPAASGPLDAHGRLLLVPPRRR